MRTYILFFLFFIFFFFLQKRFLSFSEEGLLFIYIYIYFFEKPYAKVNSLANFCEFTSRKSFSFQNILTVINLIMASLRFIGLPQNFRSLLDTKALGPPLIYLIGPLSISDPHINICVGPPNSCNALKQFNLLPPNTMF